MPIISNSIQNNGGSSQGIRSQARTYRSGNSTLHLREGQTLRGVISDIHGNDITLSMEDGSSFTGQLPDANQYSIGQKAAFLITGAVFLAISSPSAVKTLWHQFNCVPSTRKPTFTPSSR